MNKIYILIITIFLFISCSKAESDNDGISDIELNFTQFDVTLSSGEKSIGVIDNDNKHISLYDVKDPLEIVSVTYKFSEDVSIITPNPSTRIGKWEITEKFRLHSSESFEDYTVEIPDFEEPVYENQATISPLETFGTTVRYHMLDLNGDPNKAKEESTAFEAFSNQKMNGIRFPLYCGDAFGGHPSEGVVVEDVYANPLKSLENAKAAYSGSEPFMIFVGIKVLTSNKNEYYPDWVSTDEDGIIPDKYAQLLVDFIAFMDKKGHTINAIAFDKESVRMSVEDFKISADSLRAKTARLGYVVPKIVAPELLDPQGDTSNGWMNELYNKGYQDRYDIFGNHYYQRDHTVAGFAKLKYEFDLAQSDRTRPQWATEPHWNNDSSIFRTESAFGVMFDHTDLGLDAFMWWGYPIEGSTTIKSPIMRSYSGAILGSIPIRMLDHDGEETFTNGKLHTRAYLRGNEVNVFLINVVNPNIAGIVPASYEDYAVGILDGFKIDGRVTVRQWQDDSVVGSEVEGEVILVDAIEEKQFLLDIPTGTFTQLTFKIKE